ncbi:MAG: hypothetical protein ACRDY0_10790 [Acidimicrobiales bacterium]
MTGYPTGLEPHLRDGPDRRDPGTSRMAGVFRDLASRVWDLALGASGGTSWMAGVVRDLASRVWDFAHDTPGGTSRMAG